MKKCGSTCNASTIALTLVIVGALNWLLVGVFDWNLVEAIFGNIQWLERLIYILVGLSGVMVLVQCRCKICKDGSCSAKEMKCSSCDAQDCVCASASEEIEDMEKEEIKELEEELGTDDK